MRVKPEKELFEILSPHQLRELFVSISTLHEIPLKFEYMGEGAERWARLADERERNKGINALEKEVWRIAEPIIAQELDGIEFMHVVDVGCGTGRPAFLAMDILRRGA